MHELMPYGEGVPEKQGNLYTQLVFPFTSMSLSLHLWVQRNPSESHVLSGPCAN